jgi:hypothetical protein
MRLIRSLLSALLLISPSILLAQSYTGTIVGSIKDSSGAVIPRAAVTITNQQTDRQESLTADLEGRYTSLPLPHLPDARCGRIDRQQLQLDELHGEWRTADHDGHDHRWRDRLIPDRQRLHRHFGVPVGGFESSIRFRRGAIQRVASSATSSPTTSSL